MVLSNVGKRPKWQCPGRIRDRGYNDPREKHSENAITQEYQFSVREIWTVFNFENGSINFYLFKKHLMENKKKFIWTIDVHIFWNVKTLII